MLKSFQASPFSGALGPSFTLQALLRYINGSTIYQDHSGLCLTPRTRRCFPIESITKGLERSRTSVEISGKWNLHEYSIVVILGARIMTQVSKNDTVPERIPWWDHSVDAPPRIEQLVTGNITRAGTCESRCYLKV